MKSYNTYILENTNHKSCWYIDGDYDTVCKTVKMYLTYQQYKFFLKTTSAFTEKDYNVSGAFISKFGQDDLDFSFWIIRPDMPLTKAREYYDSNNYIFQGELRIEDNKLIKDTLMRDIEKYNL